MKLVYYYIQFLDEKGEPKDYRGLDQIELNLSTTDKFSFDTTTNTLRCKERETPLTANFWTNNEINPNQRNIYNINAIVGENGSGKTTAIRSLMRILDYLYETGNTSLNRNKIDKSQKELHGRFLLLLYDQEEYHLVNYAPDNYAGRLFIFTEGFYENQLHIYSWSNWKNITSDIDRYNIINLLQKTKVIYMTNSLSQYDYEWYSKEAWLRESFIYNASIGSTLSMFGSQFFLYEVYKQVKYVFDKNQVSKRKNIPELKMPRCLRIKLRTNAFENFDKPKGKTIKQIIAQSLGKLCAMAFIKNLGLRLNNNIEIDLYECDMHVSAKMKSIEEIKNSEQQFEKILQFLQCIKLTCFTILSNNKIVRGSKDGGLRVWDIYTGCYLKSIDKRPGTYPCCLNTISGEQFVCGYMDGMIQIIDAETGKCLRMLEGHTERIRDMAIVKKSKRIISYSFDNTLRIWDYTTGKCLKVINIPEIAEMMQRKMAVSPNGKKVWILNYNMGYHKIIICDTDTEECSIADQKYLYPNNITCVAAVSDNQIISGSEDGNLVVWDFATANYLYSLKAESRKITNIIVLPNGQAVCTSANGYLTIWDLDKRSEVCRLRMEPYSVVSSYISNHEIICTLSIYEIDTLLVYDISKKSLVNRLPRLNTNDYNIKEIIDQTIINQTLNTENQSLIGISYEEYEKIIQETQLLKDRCIEYVNFLFDGNKSLFSHFIQIDDSIFELSLEKIGENEKIFNEIIEFVQKYRYTCEPEYTIDFDWGLSSGEENMLRIFSNLYYIFDRDYSSDRYGDYKIYNNYNPNNMKTRKECDTVLLFMDEADLTLHPEWQRRLVEILTIFIPQIYPATCVKDIQLILTTHSPLLLGDIPNENVAYLCIRTEEDDTSCIAIKGETFGQNIHTILKDNFFLKNGAVGAFAAKKINNLAGRLAEIKAKVDEPKDNMMYDEEMIEIRKNIDLVAPGMLRNRLEELYAETLSVLNEPRRKIGIDNNKTRKREELLMELLNLSPSEVKDLVNQYYEEQRK